MFNDESVQSSFTLALRGYDRDEVESHLKSLQQQLDAAQTALVGAKEGRAEMGEELAASRREAAELRALLDAARREAGEELVEARADIAELQRQLAVEDETDAASRPLTFDDIGHNIAEVLRVAQDQADQIRDTATRAADDIRAEAETESAAARSDAELAAAEILRTATDEVAAIRADARSQADRQLEEARTEADRLREAAATEEAAALELREKAERDREQAATTLAGAHEDGDRIIQAAYDEARRRVDDLTDERERLLDQLRSLAFELDRVLAGEAVQGEAASREAVT